MAVGIAVSEGLIASIDDPLDKYEPELGASAWRGVSIRHALHMASGVKFDEAYDTSDSDVIRLSRAWARNTGELLSVLKTITQRDAEPGTRFHYSSADTQALAQTLRGAIGRPLADYVSEKIWTPMGAEADASWLIDSTGMEAAYCCLNARLRDYGRLAMLLLDRGMLAGRSIIPPEWVDAATSVGSSDVYLQPGTASSYYGYGYQTWIFPEHHGYALLGVRGQSIFVHPRLRLIMVQTAVNVRSSDPSLNRRRNQFWRELVARAERM
jgi:CubicO group peptidase (beta-lactamase class C family)